MQHFRKIHLIIVATAFVDVSLSELYGRDDSSSSSTIVFDRGVMEMLSQTYALSSVYRIYINLPYV